MNYSSSCCLAGYSALHTVNSFQDESEQFKADESAKELLAACSKGKTETIVELLRCRADVNHRYDSGLTPLHFATLHNQLEAVRVLVAAGADIFATTTDEAAVSPLSIAHVENLKEILGVLIEDPLIMRPMTKRFWGPAIITAIVSVNVGVGLWLKDTDAQWDGRTDDLFTDYFGTSAWHTYLCVSLAGVAVLSLVVVNLLDPGTVDPDDVAFIAELRNLPDDKIIVHNDQQFSLSGDKGPEDTFRWCHSCKIWKPNNVSHCSLCKRCFWRFDHHCYFVGNCVASHNHRFFALLLITGGLAWALGVYGIYLHYASHGAFLTSEIWFPLRSQQVPLYVAFGFITFGSFGSSVLLLAAIFHSMALVFNYNTKMVMRPKKVKRFRLLNNMTELRQLFSVHFQLRSWGRPMPIALARKLSGDDVAQSNSSRDHMSIVEH